jgi:energy-coupling factor transporter ATP-binding protein EcfA2
VSNSSPLPLISCRNLHFEYEPHTPVLTEVSFDISAGNLLYIVGESGSGKSTLAHLIAGIHKPTRGEIEFHGNTVPSLVLQFPEQLFLFDTVADELSSLPNSTAQSFAISFLDHFGLNTTCFESLPPGKLSFAQRRLFATSLLAAQNRSLILLDEPTLGLDEHNMSRYADWQMDNTRNGGACLVITHDMELITCAPGDVFILQNGRIYWRGPSTEFIESHALQTAAAAL